MAYDLLEAWEPLQVGVVSSVLGYGWTFSASVNITTGNQRSGSRCIELKSTDVASIPITTTLVKSAGLAYKYTSALNTGVRANPIFSFFVSTADPVWIRLNSAGLITIMSGTTELASGTTIIGVGVYNYIEAVVDMGAGTIDVYLNNPGGGIPTPEVSASFAPRAGCDRLYLGRGPSTASGQPTAYIDDIYVGNTGILYGDSAVLYDFPSSDGVSQDWVPSSAPAWERVNNVPVDPAQYIEATTAGDISTFGFDGYSETIFQLYGVALIANWLRTGASAETARIGPNISGTDYFGAAVTVPQTTAEWARYYWELNPATSAAWAPADVQTGFSASLERVT